MDAAPARARHRLWALLASILRDGGADELAPMVLRVPALRGAWIGDSTERAAEHQRIFGWEVAPWESAFLSPDGLRGGDSEDAVRVWMAEVGFAPVGIEPDHVAAEAALQAHLALAEAHAWEDDRADVAARCAALRRSFAGRHGNRWMPQLAAAVAAADDGLFAAAAALAAELMADEGDVAAPAGGAEPMDADDPSVSTLARRLGAPAWAGIWLPHAALARVARAAGASLPVCGRADRLAELVRACAAERAAAVALDEEFRAQDARLSEFERLGVAVGPARARVARARAFVATLASRPPEESWTSRPFSTPSPAP
jgi:TorA maturation chaperone TorD